MRPKDDGEDYEPEFRNVCFVLQYIILIKISPGIGHIFRMRRKVETPERKRR